MLLSMATSSRYLIGGKVIGLANKHIFQRKINVKTPKLKNRRHVVLIKPKKKDRRSGSFKSKDKSKSFIDINKKEHNNFFSFCPVNRTIFCIVFFDFSAVKRTILYIVFVGLSTFNRTIFYIVVSVLSIGQFCTLSLLVSVLWTEKFLPHQSQSGFFHKEIFLHSLACFF